MDEQALDRGVANFILQETLVAADRAAELTATSFIRLLDAHRLERTLKVDFPLAKKLYHRERAQYGFYLADFPRDDDAYVEWQTKLGDIFCAWLVKMWDQLQGKLLEWITDPDTVDEASQTSPVEIREIPAPKLEEDPDQMSGPLLEDYVFSMEERDQMAYDQWVKRYQDESVVDAEMVRVAYGDRPLGDLSAASRKRSIDVDFPLEANVASIESEKRKRTRVKAKRRPRSRPSTADGTLKSRPKLKPDRSSSKSSSLKRVTLAFEEHSEHDSEKKTTLDPSLMASTVIRSHKKQSHPSSQEGSFLRIDPRFRKQMINEREKRKKRREILERDVLTSFNVQSSSQGASSSPSPSPASASSIAEKGKRPLELTKAWEEAYLTHDLMQEAMRQKEAKIEQRKTDVKTTKHVGQDQEPIDRDVVKRLARRPQSPTRFMRKRLASAGRVAHRGDPSGFHDQFDDGGLDVMELGPSDEMSLSEWFEMEMIMRDMELQDQHSRIPKRRIQSAQPRKGRRKEGNGQSADWEVVEEEEEVGFRIAPYDLKGSGPKG
eukprot:TRINITY_DN28494_c0_g1_i1.p1 TRINITY_DN28494_c0_g1~~TRINITY_DN28494_c0_g1_i1.p1  ORF type:complete len:548 (+),score=183.75 TRINITY_DN28494_c0_g1_i1:63-1706(+)